MSGPEPNPTPAPAAPAHGISVSAQTVSTFGAVFLALIAAFGSWMQSRVNFNKMEATEKQLVITKHELANETGEIERRVLEESKTTGEKLQQIHVLVDGNLSTALREIASLKQIIADRDPGDKDKARGASDAAVDSQRSEEIQRKAEGGGAVTGTTKPTTRPAPRRP